MRNRPIRTSVYLTDEENKNLCELCEKTGLGKTNVIRLLIMGYVPPEAPPIEHRKIIMELRRLGNNINQILHLARVNGFINPKELQKHLDELDLIEDEMHEAYDFKKRDIKWQ